jgi:8-oxo-dGTP pyrophosphatase MutT (NUDIX family)
MNDEVTNKSPGFVAAWSHTQPSQPLAKFLRVSQLRRLRDCEQVAAVCYRIRRGAIEFLLVQTRSRRWTFPKGGTEPGLTQAQAAALEAFEEAGVHGRMEEISFAHYVKRSMSHGDHGRRKRGLAVSAYLCEVLRLDSPRERKRNRTWFSAEKAKRRLREDRNPDFGAELARVVDRAMSRIQRLRYGNAMLTGGLQNLQLTVENGNTAGKIRRAKALTSGSNKHPKVLCIDQF